MTGGRDLGLPAVARWRVPRCGPRLAMVDWTSIPVLPAFTVASGEGPARFETAVRLAWNETALLVRFDCHDPDPRATLVERDAPLWREEVVELFLAAGSCVPNVYREIEFNPLGAVFDALVRNPDGRRDTMIVDATWDWPGLEWETVKTLDRWIVNASLPWPGLGSVEPPPQLRGNVYRVKRPLGADAEFSCWCPTLTHPADFHKPERFGLLTLEE